MLIGQLSKRTGFSIDTIRYYEKIGLIVMPERRRSAAKYKDYPDEVVATLAIIRKYKGLGFTLEEIRELLVLRSIKVLDIGKLLELMTHKITGIDTAIEELHATKMRLNREYQLLLSKKTGRTVVLPEFRVAA